MSPSRTFLALLFPALLLLAAAGAEAQPAPAPAPAAPPAEATTDAWGNPVDVESQVRSHIAASLAAPIGSPEFMPLAFRILELDGETLRRAYGSAGFDLNCGQRYRRENPENTAAQYVAFSATPEGVAWQKACLADQLADRQLDPRLADGMVASIEIGLMVPYVLKAIRQQRAEQGLADLPELTPEMEAKLPLVVGNAFTMSRCLLRKALEQAPLSRMTTEPAAIQAAIVAAFESGVCDSPAPPPAS